MRHPGLQDMIVSAVPAKEERGEGQLPSGTWIRDLTPPGTAGVFQRGNCWYYKCVSAKKGSLPEVSMVLAAFLLFNYCPSYNYKEPRHEW